MSRYLGGKLAYRYGVRVADEQTQAHGYTSRASRRSVASPRAAAVTYTSLDRR